MTLDDAIRILGDIYDPNHRGLAGEDRFVSWRPGDPWACLDDDFNVNELEAMVVVMRAGGAT